MKFAPLCVWVGALAFAAPASAVVIYGVTSADGESFLYTIDATDGTAQLKGSLGVDRVSAIDFHPNGTLYGLNSSDYSLRTINTSNGASAVVAFLDPASTYTDMTFSSDGSVL